MARVGAKVRSRVTWRAREAKVCGRNRIDAENVAQRLDASDQLRFRGDQSLALYATAGTVAVSRSSTHAISIYCPTDRLLLLELSSGAGRAALRDDCDDAVTVQCSRAPPYAFLRRRRFRARGALDPAEGAQPDASGSPAADPPAEASVARDDPQGGPRWTGNETIRDWLSQQLHGGSSELTITEADQLSHLGRLMHQILLCYTLGPSAALSREVVSQWMSEMRSQHPERGRE